MTVGNTSSRAVAMLHCCNCDPLWVDRGLQSLLNSSTKSANCCTVPCSTKPSMGAITTPSALMQLPVDGGVDRRCCRSEWVANAPMDLRSPHREEVALSCRDSFDLPCYGLALELDWQRPGYALMATWEHSLRVRLSCMPDVASDSACQPYAMRQRRRLRRSHHSRRACRALSPALRPLATLREGSGSDS